MKTPEEIKKGLECCVTRYNCHFDDEQCCYHSSGVSCHYDVMKDALAYIRQLEAQVPKWISVEERLPEKREIVVVTDGTHTWDYGEFMGLAFCFDNEDPNRHKWNWKKHTVKHVEWWMPKKTALPEPPKEG